MSLPNMVVVAAFFVAISEASFTSFAQGQQTAAGTAPTKTRSVLFPADMAAKAKASIAAYPWAAAMQEGLVANAAPWRKMSDEDLWNLMFGPNITRSWMVWSDGFCPACTKDVKMYTWEIDPWSIPWKVRCPHCKEIFPKNDFAAFHKSGLDEHGVFVPARADRSLLFNADHPDPADPLHGFGVDDGEGYVDSDGHRWRFIGAYLIYGQWKKWIVAGVTNLSNAYLVTGDPEYACKTAILLDRVADVFPLFDFGQQGVVYEGRTGGPLRGQVSTWHDACEEVRELTLGYDRVFEAARDQEKALTAFLSKKAQDHKLDNPKKSWADIQRNIEERILQDTLAHRERIESNYPTTDRALLAIKTVLNWPGNRDEVMGLLDGILDKSTAVDGVSGEKGLAGYTTIAPHAVAELLAQFSRIEPGFLRAVYARRPTLHACYRFHVDTWCMESFYPHCGDSGGFGAQVPSYAGVTFSRNPGTNPSMYAFLWDLYELTRDPVFVQVLYRENGHSLDNLPHDLFAQDSAGFQARVKEVIDKVGAEIVVPSVNKQQWRIALLRAGAGRDQRTLWIDYDSGERHSHADGMNIGLVAKGLDLIPEFGYPPVGYGGWESPKAVWYTKTAAHVTVVVDGQDQNRVNSGATRLWADGRRFRAIRVSDPAMIAGKRYERLVALVDLDDRDSYVLDCFQVEGGKDHAKFFHSFFGPIETQGLSLEEAEDYGYATEMRHFRRDAKPAPGWSVDWTIEDHYKYLPEPRNIHLRYTDLTSAAAAYLAEAWIDVALYGGTGGTYVPCVMTRRTGRGDTPLVSTFAAVIEPYEGASNLTGIRRLPLTTAAGAPLPDSSVGIEVARKDGRRDLCVIPDTESTEEALEPVNGLRVRAALGFVTCGAQGPERLVLCQGTKIEIGPVALTLKQRAEFVEVVLGGDQAKVVSGGPAAIVSLTRAGNEIKVIAD